MNKKYSSYINVDQKWVKSIPSHWDAKRLKFIFSMRKEKNNPVVTDNILSLTAKQGVVPYAEKEDVGGNKPKSDLTLYNVAHENDLLVNCMNIVSGAAGVSRYFGAISPVYYALVLRRNDNVWYYHYIFRLLPFQRSLVGLGKGIQMHESEDGTLTTVRMRISIDYLGGVLLPIPPKKEQDQIVRFLDWKISSINKLIAVRKKQISEFEALKRSKISYLIMGQNKNTPQKETLVSWVKTIPEHWNETTVVQFAEEQQIKNTGMIEKNLLSLSYGKIIRKDINTTSGLLPASFEGYQIVHNGNIVLRLTDLQNDHKSLRTGLAMQTGIITSAYTCLKVRDGILPEYLQLQLHVADLCKVFYGMGGGVRQSIGFKDVRRLIIAIPPIEEQQKILDEVHGIEEPVNKVIQKYRTIISELEDLRNRIVFNVVTGRVDVRDVIIPKYDFVSEESEDDSEDDSDTDDTEEQEE